MSKKLTKQDKLDILSLVLLPQLESALKGAAVELEQAKEDWVSLYAVDGDKEKVKKAPILSVVEGQVSVESARNCLREIKRLLSEGTI